MKNGCCLGFEYSSSRETCHIVDESHKLEESDLFGEADDVQGKDVYVLLNLDGSLPLTEPWSTAYSHDAQIALRRDNKLTTFPLLPLQWRVTFDFMPRNVDMAVWNNAHNGPWSNVLYITADSCGGIHKCRVPNVLFNPEMGVKVILYDKGEFEQHEFHDPSILPHFEWTKIEISQEIECDQIIHQVTINGVEKYRKEVEGARRIRNLKVYASALWGALIQERGYMKGLSIQIRRP